MDFTVRVRKNILNTNTTQRNREFSEKEMFVLAEILIQSSTSIDIKSYNLIQKVIDHHDLHLFHLQLIRSQFQSVTNQAKPTFQ